MFKDFFFEYVYYRFYLIDRKMVTDQGFLGAAVIALIQVMLSFEILISILRGIFEVDATRYSKQFGYGSIVVLIGLAWWNAAKYKDKLSLFEDRWGNEDGNLRMKKGVLVFVTIILPFLPLLIYLKL